MRLFIALDLTNEVGREIEKFLKTLQKKHWKVNWEKIEKLHLTLVFLGEVEKNKVEVIKETLREMVAAFGRENKIQTVGLSFKGLGCFPDFDLPRIIWLGLRGDLKSLVWLKKQTERRLLAEGFKVDEKPFAPHITLGRVKRARVKERREIGRQIKALRKLNFLKPWLVDRLTLYESHCLSEGSVYKKLAEFIF